MAAAAAAAAVAPAAVDVGVMPENDRVCSDAAEAEVDRVGI